MSDCSDPSNLARLAALSPEEQAHSDAYERSPGNEAELERAIATERDPANRALLQQEYGRLFNGASVPLDAPEPPARDRPAAKADGGLAAFEKQYGHLLTGAAPAGDLPTPFSMYGI